MKTPWQGAQTTMYTILSPKIESGAYYAACKKAKVNPLLYDDELGDKVWELSMKKIAAADVYRH